MPGRVDEAVEADRQEPVGFDRAAAIRAARAVLAAAPTIEGANGGELAVDLGKLVDTITAAGNPAALAIPPYDEELAQSARYRLEQDVGTELGAQMAITAHLGGVAIGVSRQGSQLVAGLVAVDSAWYTGLALCSAAMEVRRLKEAKGARDGE